MKTLFDSLKNKRWLGIVPFVLAMLVFAALNVDAQQTGRKRKGTVRRIIRNTIPEGYTQLEGTQLYYSRKVGGVFVGSLSVGSIDLIGKFGDKFYSSTYGDYGYVVALKVNDNPASFADCLNGSQHNGVSFRADIEPQGEMARMYYTLTNTNDYDVQISLGAYDDVYVGDNIAASITRKIDSYGGTYGISLADGEGAQLCVLFGAGLTGVTGVDDFWFGSYYVNATADAVACNYSSGENYMVENGSYDCGIGWGWKERIIKAGQTAVFSYLIAIGDVNLEPTSNFEVTPEDPEGWNDLSRLHVLAMQGDYESPAGLSGHIEYSVEDSEEWITLTGVLESGSTFNDTVRAIFNPELSKHTIKFRTVDQVGNTTLLPSIVYPDVAYYPVSGIADKTYTGDSLFQTNITCDLDESQYELKTYRNNVNVGLASFNIEGVFPYTIGRKKYTFNIYPQPLSGEIQLSETAFVYNGNQFTPDWQFSNSNYTNLESNKDYTLSWSNNKLPGTGILTVTGMNNYTGSLTAEISIDKAPLKDNLFTLTLPDEDITYDEQSHGASITKSAGVGNATISYQKAGDTEATTTKPAEAGDYTIYLEFADGSLYYGRERVQVGAFSIYQFSADEWAILQTVLSQLTTMGWSQPWDVSQGMKGVSTLQGLTIEGGHVTGLDLSGQNLTGEFPYLVLDLPQLSNLDLSNNKLSGNIGQYANKMGGLTTLNVSNNCISEVNPMIPVTVSDLSLNHQAIDRIMEIDLSQLSSDYLADQMPSILLYDHTQQSYSPNVKLLCTTADDTWSTRLQSQNDQVNFIVTSAGNVYRGQSGDIFNVALLNNNGTREGSTFQMKLNFDAGDSNFDGQVDVLDLQTIINYMFEEYTSKPFNYTAANLWKDEVINVQDAVSFVNMLIDTNTAPARQRNTARRVAVQPSEETFSSVTIVNGYLTINSTVPVSAFDIIVLTNQQAEIVSALKHIGFTCTSKWNGNNLHLVGYSLNGAEIPAGETAICALNSGIVSYAMLADRDADKISVSLNGGTTTGVQPSMLNPSSQEVYRIPVGAKRSIIIDTTGRKTIIKDKK